MKWVRRMAAVLLAATVVHLAAVWVLPRAIVLVVRRRLAAQVGVNHVHHAPLPGADWHTIAMPSPDQLYSACSFDVSDGPVLVTATMPDGYFSISGFASNTDNFFVVDDRAAPPGRHQRVVLTRDPSFKDPEGGVVVVPPTTTGVVLFRQLVLDRSTVAAAQVVQQASSCAPM